MDRWMGVMQRLSNQFSFVSKRYRKRFWKKALFDAVDELRVTLERIYGNQVSMAEASFRWLYHHSMLDGIYSGEQERFLSKVYLRGL